MTTPAGDEASHGGAWAHLPPPPVSLPPPPPVAAPAEPAAGRTCALLGAAALGCGFVVFSLWRSVAEDAARNENEMPMEAPVAWLATVGAVGLAVATLLVGLGALGAGTGTRKQVGGGIAMSLVGAVSAVAIVLHG